MQKFCEDMADDAKLEPESKGDADKPMLPSSKGKEVK